jgi:ATP-dependent RNA helicase DeaD
LHGNLMERGFAAVALSGELSQAERAHALQALRDGHARVCVATDVAARGLDLPDLGLVIQADPPRNAETLLHRSGRTGRAGRKGICVLLVPHSRRRGAERQFADAGIRAEWSSPPPADRIRARDLERLLRDVGQTEEQSEEDIAAVAALLAERTPEELAAALVRMHRARLPAPEELSEPMPQRIRHDDRDRPATAPDRRSEAPRRGEDTVMFRMNIGRNHNADPRWIIPVICRRGGITKNEIGAIRIQETETLFEIVAHAAQRFGEAARKPDAKDPNIRFAAADDPTAPTGEPARPADTFRRPKPRLPRFPGAQRKADAGRPARFAPDAGERPLRKKTR